MSDQRRRQRQERRARVLRATLEVVAERGLSATRMSDIAERTGMSAGHVLYYFKSKNDLLMQALRWSEEDLLRRAHDEFTRLPAAADRFVRFAKLAAPVGPADPGWVLWVEVWSLAPHDRELARAHAPVDRRYMRAWADVVRYGQGTGEFLMSVDADDFALRFSALMDGLAVKVVAGLPHLTAARLLDTCLGVAAKELGCDLPRTRRWRAAASP